LKAIKTASRLLKSPEAFNLSKEPGEVYESYSIGPFASMV
jgi:hypothetical protein